MFYSLILESKLKFNTKCEKLQGFNKKLVLIKNKLQFMDM